MKVVTHCNQIPRNSLRGARQGLAMIELTGIIAENAPQLKTTAALRDAATAVLEEIKERDAERKKR